MAALFVAILSSLLFTLSVAETDVQRSSYVQRLTEDEFQQFIRDSKVRIVYFKKQVEPPAAQAFLIEYENAAEALHAFEISLGLVECDLFMIPKYCSADDSNERSAYGFRDGKEKIALPVETLYDVNAIVSSALHLTLINSVPIIQSTSERKELEVQCKGKCNIVFTFQRSLGTYEHRIFMVVAYNFLNKYIFAMTTFENAIHGLRRLETELDIGSALEGPALWVLSCKEVTDGSQECPQSSYNGPMEMQDIVHFLSTFELPITLELLPNSEMNRTVYDDYELHTVYLLFNKYSNIHVRSLGPQIGQWLRGIIGVVLIDLELLTKEEISKIGFDPEKIRPPSIGFRPFGTTQIIFMNEFDNAYHFILDQLRFLMGSQDDRQEEREPIQELDELLQDDEVALSLQQSSKYPLSLIPTLTREKFTSLLDDREVAFVLYYLPWDPVCQKVLQLFAEVASQWTDSRNPQPISRLDCFDWTDLCNNITHYPTIHIFRRNEPVLDFRGPMEVNSIITTLHLFQMSNVKKINSKSELEQFISCNMTFHEEKHLMLSSVVLVGVRKSDEERLQMVEAAAKFVHGRHLVGICGINVCDDLAKLYKLSFPFAMIFKGDDLFHPQVVMEKPFSVASLIKFMHEESTFTFPELNEYNFPEYYVQGKLLLLYFLHGKDLDEYFTLGKLALSKAFPDFSFLWMNASVQLVRSIQESLFSSEEIMPNLAVLDIKNSATYRFPANELKEDLIKSWLTKISKGLVSPTGMLPVEEWKPRLPGFDYLRFIEEDHVREMEDRISADGMPEKTDDLHQSRLYRLPGSSEKRRNDLRVKVTITEETPSHQHIEL